MHLRTLIAAALLVASLPASAEVQQLAVPSRTLGSSRRVEVYLPPGYHQDRSRRYPVLYLQDGQNLFNPRAMHGGWAVDRGAERQICSGRACPAIIVGIHNSPARMREYTPSRDAEVGDGGGADRYLDFVTRELKPFIDSRFRTLRGPQNTGIGGSSLGGLLALHAGLTRPNVFGKVLAMSPSLWWNNREMIDRVARTPNLPSLRLYLDSGGPRDGKANTDAMRDLLAGKGLRFNENLWHWHEPGAVHNEAAWRARFPRAFGALFPR